MDIKQHQFGFELNTTFGSFSNSQGQRQNNVKIKKPGKSDTAFYKNLIRSNQRVRSALLGGHRKKHTHVPSNFYGSTSPNAQFQPSAFAFSNGIHNATQEASTHLTTGQIQLEVQSKPLRGLTQAQLFQRNNHLIKSPNKFQSRAKVVNSNVTNPYSQIRLDSRRNHSGLNKSFQKNANETMGQQEKNGLLISSLSQQRLQEVQDHQNQQDELEQAQIAKPSEDAHKTYQQLVAADSSDLNVLRHETQESDPLSGRVVATSHSNHSQLTMSQQNPFIFHRHQTAMRGGRAGHPLRKKRRQTEPDLTQAVQIDQQKSAALNLNSNQAIAIMDKVSTKRDPFLAMQSQENSSTNLKSTELIRAGSHQGSEINHSKPPMLSNKFVDSNLILNEEEEDEAMTPVNNQKLTTGMYQTSGVTEGPTKSLSHQNQDYLENELNVVLNHAIHMRHKTPLNGDNSSVVTTMRNSQQQIRTYEGGEDGGGSKNATIMLLSPNSLQSSVIPSNNNGPLQYGITEYINGLKINVRQSGSDQTAPANLDTQPSRLSKNSEPTNFLKYSEQDFESYLEYLCNDNHDFFDRQFLSRLEHQTKILKRLINLQAAQAIASVEAEKNPNASPKRMVAQFQKAVKSYTSKIDNIQDKLKDLLSHSQAAGGKKGRRRQQKSDVAATQPPKVHFAEQQLQRKKSADAKERSGNFRRKQLTYRTVPSKLLEFGGRVTQAQTNRDKTGDNTVKLKTLNLSLNKNDYPDSQTRGTATQQAQVPPSLLVSSTQCKNSAIQNGVHTGSSSNGNNNIKRIVVDYVSPSNKNFQARPSPNKLIKTARYDNESLDLNSNRSFGVYSGQKLKTQNQAKQADIGILLVSQELGGGAKRPNGSADSTYRGIEDETPKQFQQQNTLQRKSREETSIITPQAADQEVAAFGGMTDKEFQRHLALQQTNNLAERKLIHIKEQIERQAVGSGQIVSTSEVISAASSHRKNDAEQKVSALSQVQERKEIAIQNTIDAEGVSRVTPAHLDDVVEWYRGHQEKSPYSGEIGIPLVEQRTKIQTETDRKGMISALSNHNVATDEKQSTINYGQEEHPSINPIKNDRVNSLRRPQTSQRSPSPLTTKLNLKAPTQIQIITSSAEKVALVEPHLINSERLIEPIELPDTPSAIEKFNVDKSAIVASRKQQSASLTPKASTPKQQIAFCANSGRMISDASDNDNISIIGSQIEQQQSAKYDQSRPKSFKSGRAGNFLHQKSQSVSTTNRIYNKQPLDSTAAMRAAQVNNPVLNSQQRVAVNLKNLRKPSTNEEMYRMPDCLKELVDYKNSQDYLMFKQLHKQLNAKSTHQRQPSNMQIRQNSSRLIGTGGHSSQMTYFDDLAEVPPIQGQQPQSFASIHTKPSHPYMSSQRQSSSRGIFDRSKSNPRQNPNAIVSSIYHATEMQAESREVRQIISQNTRPKSAQKRKSYQETQGPVGLSSNRSSQRTFLLNSVGACIERDTSHTNIQVVGPEPRPILSNQGSQSRLALGFPQSDQGRSKYIPLSKIAKHKAKEPFPAYFSSELDLQVSRPTGSIQNHKHAVTFRNQQKLISHRVQSRDPSQNRPGQHKKSR